MARERDLIRGQCFSSLAPISSQKGLTAYIEVLINDFGIGFRRNPAPQLAIHMLAAVKIVAERLGNRPSTCRNYYVHPCIIDTYRQGSLPRMGELIETDTPETELSAAELCVLQVIVKHGIAT